MTDPIERAIQNWDASVLELIWCLCDASALTSPGAVAIQEMAAAVSLARATVTGLRQARIDILAARKQDAAPNTSPQVTRAVENRGARSPRRHERSRQ
jgi:hypothetical protein